MLHVRYVHLTKAKPIHKKQTHLLIREDVTSIMFLDIIHRLVHFLKNTTFRRLDSVSVLR
jgi:hypothetical protein